MIRTELIELCSGDFYENFAEISADKVLDCGAFEQLLTLNFECEELPLPQTIRDKVAFRSSYIIEVMYFRNRSAFEPYYERFLETFTRIKNPSSKRHYGKIALDIIECGYVPSDYDSIATTCVDWIILDNSRVVVKIWAMEILLVLRTRVEWLDEIIQNILVTFAQNNPSPAIICRMRKWCLQALEDSNHTIVAELNHKIRKYRS